MNNMPYVGDMVYTLHTNPMTDFSSVVFGRISHITKKHIEVTVVKTLLFDKNDRIIVAPDMEKFRKSGFEYDVEYSPIRDGYCVKCYISEDKQIKRVWGGSEMPYPFLIWEGSPLRLVIERKKFKDMRIR